VQASSGVVHVVHEGGLGDFDDEGGGVQAAGLQGVADVVGDVVVVELARRDVDRDVEGVAAGVPRRHLLACVLEDPAADVTDLSALLEHGNELVGTDQPSSWVIPAEEGFDADEGEVIEVVDGLVDQPVLVVRQGRTQIALQLGAATRVGLHLWVEDRIAVLPCALGLVESNVGVAQEILAAVVALSCAGAAGDADTEIDDERRRPVAEVEGFAHHVEQALRDELRRDFRGAALDEYDELVAAHASDRVHSAQRLGQPGSDGDEQPVPGSVAEGVVDVLEVVQVHEQGGTCGVVAAVTGEHLLDSVDHQRPVREPRQRIMHGLMMQLAGALVQLSPRALSPGAQDEHEHGQKHADGEAGDQHHQRFALGGATSVDDAERMHGPPVVQVDRRRLGAVEGSAAGELDVHVTSLIAHRDREAGLALQGAVEQDIGVDLGGDQADEGRSTIPQGGRRGAATVDRGLDHQ
jgi:hypothetical protein